MVDRADPRGHLGMDVDAVLRDPADPLNLPAAVVFYLVYILGILVLAIWPNRRSTPLSRSSARFWPNAVLPVRPCRMWPTGRACHMAL